MKARHILISLAAILLAGCGSLQVPLAWSCAPVAPLPHYGEEGLSFFGGGQVGQPSLGLDDDLRDWEISKPSYLYGRGQIGLSGQWHLLRTNFSLWGAGGSGKYNALMIDSTIATVQDRFRAFHFQWDIAAAPRVGEKVRLEFGMGAGGGVQSGSRIKEGYGMVGGANDRSYQYPLITGGIFAGMGYSLRADQTIGFRWYLLGLGTGWVLSYRWRFLQAYMNTQLIPLMDLPAPNWAVGIQGFLPLGEE